MPDAITTFMVVAVTIASIVTLIAVVSAIAVVFHLRLRDKRVIEAPIASTEHSLPEHTPRT
jgi:hypothetical protein